MRFVSLTCVFAALVALAVGCLFALPAAAYAALVETGQITSPAPGTALTTGKPVTVKAVVTDACKATLTLRTPAGDKTNLVTETGNATCLGDISLTGTFTPDAPGDYTLTLIGSVPLSEASLKATAAPSPTPTVTVTETTTPTATPTTTASQVNSTASPSVTVTTTLKPKTSATPKPSTTAKSRPTATTTVTAPAAPDTTGQQPTVINVVPAIPTAAPSGTDTNDLPFPPAAPVTTVTAQPDYAAHAYQNMAANSGNGSLWDAVLPVVTIMAILAGIAAAAWIGFKTFRKRGRHH
ncbi:hypothetical protein [Nonomuraea basaltis]|uniref:hypothetical protein n=1 Tax=Nonomuraea basaltis TaxID=2495887 RepID=UPI00110C3F99|nr:hypothetical protein [Nonomuraea basaltis]TMR92555.1 hypothetical protein EJK15_43925 [Nonomuraea basaltis]